MTAGAYGFSLHAANHTFDEKDRIPKPVVDHLTSVAGSIAMGKILYDGDAQPGDASLQDKLEMVEAGVNTVGNIVSAASSIYDAVGPAVYRYVHADGTPLKVPGVEKSTVPGTHPYIRAKRLASTGSVGQPQCKLRKSIGGSTSAVIGSSALVSAGEQRAMPLKMKLGKQMVAKDSLANLFSYVNGRGTVVSEFGGWMESPINARNTTWQIFRHNLSNEDNKPTINGIYGAAYKILVPAAGSLEPVPGNPPSLNVDFANPYHAVGKNDTWFAPLNRSDYEDMSWNLNKLKFINDINQSFATDAKLLQGEAQAGTGGESGLHRQHSLLYQNNLTPATVNPQGQIQSQLRPQYNMVFNSGSCSYDFMNKGDGPLKAIVSVWRVKKHHVMSNDPETYNMSGSSQMPVPAPFNTYRGIPGQLYTGIGQGYNDSMKAKLGTDQMNGKDPLYSDVWEDPNTPFLPVTRYTHASDMPCKEVSRFEFALASGSRRNLTVEFGGEIYDPTTVQQRTGTYNGTLDELFPEIVDQFSYIVCISTAGCRVSRGYDPANQTSTDTDASYRLGDMVSGSMLQWKARYVEKLGAVAYKKPKRNNITVSGMIEQYGGTGSSLITGEKPVTMLPQSSAVRQPPTYDGTGAKVTSSASHLSNKVG